MNDEWNWGAFLYFARECTSTLPFSPNFVNITLQVAMLCSDITPCIVDNYVIEQCHVSYTHPYAIHVFDYNTTIKQGSAPRSRALPLL